MKVTLLFIVVGLAILPMSCGDVDGGPWDGKGVVTALLYDDEDTWTTTSPGACLGYDDDGSCTMRMPDTVHYHHDEPHWHVQITGEDGREHRFEVAESNWQRCRRGSEWLNDEKRCLG
jgi:hypothetical protein